MRMLILATMPTLSSSLFYFELNLFVQGQQTDYIMDNVSELLTKFKAPRELKPWDASCA